MVESCPTDVVEAPAELIWDLFIEPDGPDAWVDAKLVEGPGRAMASGDRLRFTTGPLHLFEVRWTVGEMARPTTLALHIELPFGIVNEEVVRIVPMGERRCRVTFQ
jgi:hypothetical protein